MKPTKELIGKTANEVSLKMLERELAEREALHDEFIEQMRDEDWSEEEWNKEMNLKMDAYIIFQEIERFTLQSDRENCGYPIFRTDAEYEAFSMGMECALRQAQQKSINSRHVNVSASKVFAIQTAAKVFKNSGAPQIGEVAEHIAAGLKADGMHCPKISQIKRWLNDAEKGGMLHIPLESHRKGRRKKK